MFPPHSSILFQGDSITDCGRDRRDPASLGSGYVALLAPSLIEQGHRVLNRGCSGHRVHDLLGRWTQDTIELKPQVLSILLGINNVWRRYDNDDPTDLDIFVSEYRNLLERTRSQLGDELQLILCEPFLLHVSPERASWREDLNPKIEAIHQLAHEFNALLVPFDQDFQQASHEHPPRYWAEDGVHPSEAGHRRMASLWQKTVKAL